MIYGIKHNISLGIDPSHILALKYLIFFFHDKILLANR